eukprot:1455494-Pleurochrysis_carterae.AAC.1
MQRSVAALFAAEAAVLPVPRATQSLSAFVLPRASTAARSASSSYSSTGVPCTCGAKSQTCNEPEASAGCSAARPSVAGAPKRRQQASSSSFFDGGSDASEPLCSDSGSNAGDAAYEAACDASDCSECDDSQQAAKVGSHSAKSRGKRPSALEYSRNRN